VLDQEGIADLGVDEIRNDRPNPTPDGTRKPFARPFMAGSDRTYQRTRVENRE
jgi:hypothetical protein